MKFFIDYKISILECQSVMDRNHITLAEACDFLGLQEQVPTISVIQAGKSMGIGRDSAYAAVRAGELPCLQVGRLMRVPVIALAMKLLGEAPAPD